MRHSFEDIDYLSLSAPERLLLAQELLDSVFDVVTEPRRPMEQSGHGGKQN